MTITPVGISAYDPFLPSGATGDDVVEFFEWETRGEPGAKWVVKGTLNRGRGESHVVILFQVSHSNFFLSDKTR